MSRQRGQASVEWIAVVAVVFVAFAGAFAAGVPGTDAVPRALRASFARAFCLVAGGDCLGGGGPRPCVVRSDERSRERRATIAVVRLADGRTLLREDRSDGSVAISVEDGARIGGGFMWGGELSVGGRGVKAAATLHADGRGGRGRRFVVRDAAAADALLARLGEESGGVGRVVGGDGDGDPVPDERWWVIGKGGGADATLKAVRLGASADLVRSAVAGVRSRPRTGERALLLRTDGELVAALTGPLQEKLGLALGQRTAVELGLDARGLPASLTVRAARGINGEAALGPLRSGGGDLLEAEVRLDLADPVLRSEAKAFVAAIGDVAPGRAVAAARAMGGRLVERARIDLRLYATDRSSSVKGVAGGLFARFGYEVEEINRTARLVEAVGREPGLGWARRLDCVGVA